MKPLKLAVQLVTIVTFMMLSPIIALGADNANSGKLQLNDQVIQNRNTKEESGSHITKAEETMPDLFDPTYKKGLVKQSKADTLKLKQKTDRAFQTNTKKVDSAAVKNKKVNQKLFKTATKSSSTEEIAKQKGSNFGLIVILVVGGFSVIGVVIGIKGHKLLFRKWGQPKNG